MTLKQCTTQHVRNDVITDRAWRPRAVTGISNFVQISQLGLKLTGTTQTTVCMLLVQTDGPYSSNPKENDECTGRNPRSVLPHWDEVVSVLKHGRRADGWRYTSTHSQLRPHLLVRELHSRADGFTSRGHCKHFASHKWVLLKQGCAQP